MKNVVLFLSILMASFTCVNAKNNPGINSTWVNVIEGEGNSSFRRVITDGEAVYAAGDYVGDGQLFGDIELPITGYGVTGLLSKMDTNGNIMWTLSVMGTNMDVIVDLAIAKDGNVMILGWTASDVMSLDGVEYPNQSSFTANTFVAKINKETGKVMWIKMTESDDLRSVWGGKMRIGNDGSIYFTGTYDGNFTLEGHTLETTDYVYEDPFVAKMDADGNVIWMKGFNGAGSQSARSIAVTSDNNVVFCIDYEAPIEMGGEMLPFEGSGIYWTAIAKLDAEGNCVKAVAYGNPFYPTTSKGIEVDANNNIYSSILFSESIEVEDLTIETIGEQSTVLLKFDSNLNYIKDVVLGSSGFDQAFGMEQHEGLIYLSVKYPTLYDFICDAVTKEKINKVSPGCGGYAILSYNYDLQYVDGGSFNSQNLNESTINPPIRFGISDGNLYLGADYSGDNELILGKVYTTEPEHGNAYVLKYKISNFGSVGIDDVDVSNDVRLYPNPVSTSLTISMDEEIVGVTVFSADGKVINAQLINNSIDVSSLKSGLYLINIVTKDTTISKTFIKK